MLPLSQDLLSRGGVSTPHALSLTRFLSTLVVAGIHGDAELEAQRPRYLSLMQVRTAARCRCGRVRLQHNAP